MASTAVDGIVYVSGFINGNRVNGPMQGAIYALDENTGQLLWQYLAGGDFGLGDAPPSIAKNILLESLLQLCFYTGVSRAFLN